MEWRADQGQEDRQEGSDRSGRGCEAGGRESARSIWQTGGRKGEGKDRWL